MVETAPKLSSTEATEVLTSFYETGFGVFNHADKILGKTRPLASVALHESEDNTKGSSLYELIELYITKDIMKHLGLSLKEFLDLPREFTIMIFDSLTKKAISDNKTIDGIEKSFNPEKNK